jgi:hypothetical protein
LQSEFNDCGALCCSGSQKLSGAAVRLVCLLRCCICRKYCALGEIKHNSLLKYYSFFRIISLCSRLSACLPGKRRRDIISVCDFLSSDSPNIFHRFSAFLISLFSLFLHSAFLYKRGQENGNISTTTAAAAASLTHCYILQALFKNDRDIEIKCAPPYFDKFEKFSTCLSVCEPTENGSLGCCVPTLNIC